MCPNYLGPAMKVLAPLATYKTKYGEKVKYTKEWSDLEKYVLCLLRSIKLVLRSEKKKCILLRKKNQI